MKTFSKSCRCVICSLLCPVSKTGHASRLIVFTLCFLPHLGLAQDSIAVQTTAGLRERLLEAQRKDSLSQIYYDSVRRGPFRTQYLFSLSPISRRVEKVNGLVLGVGHYRSRLIPMQAVNGINLEVNGNAVAATALLLFGLPGHEQVENLRDSIPMPATCHRINGLNISTGGFLEGAEVNGINISVATNMNRMSGFSISPGCLIAYKANGVSISGIVHATQTMNGVSFGLFNTNINTRGLQLGGANISGNLKGGQIGLVNVVSHRSGGIQIGLVNHSKSNGFQIGLLNINKKRALPFINW